MSQVINMRAERAKRIAAEAKERNKPRCQCETCRQIEMLPAVQQLTKNYQPVRRQA